jgi:hydroxymethylpyrimidine/phosphomethylpyrimidine kinase
MALETAGSKTDRHLASGTSVLAIGGLDSSGGAGLVRDFMTAGAFGVPAHLIATAWTLQVPTRVEAIEPRSVGAICADLNGAIEALRPGAIKVGMVATAEIAAVIAEVVAGQAAPTVYDPVLRASTGRALFGGDLGAVRALLRAATLVTPNLDEAAVLAGRKIRASGGFEGDGDTHDGARAAGELLLRAGARAVLIKGGHGTGATADDLLVTSAGVRVFSAPRLPGKSPRGTGCALATAIAVGLARGEPLEAAIGAAKTWLHQAIANATDRGGQRVL